MRVRPIFAWYDLWVGAFWDQKKRVLYIFPVPCLGLKIEFGPTDKTPDATRLYCEVCAYEFLVLHTGKPVQIGCPKCNRYIAQLDENGHKLMTFSSRDKGEWVELG